jgi:nitroreductase
VEQRLYAAIPRRHSNRAPFVERPVPVQVRAELIAAARAEGGWLDLLLGPMAIETTAELVQAADHLLRRSDEYQNELASWTRSDGTATDGVPASAGGPAPSPDEMLRRRDFGGPGRAGQLDFEREPLLAVLGTTGDRPGDQIQAGQALQRVLLTATNLGLAASMFSQPIEVPAVREQLRLALGRHAPPQMLLRFGYAVEAPASPRRPVSEVVVR